VFSFLLVFYKQKYCDLKFQWKYFFKRHHILGTCGQTYRCRIILATSTFKAYVPRSDHAKRALIRQFLLINLSIIIVEIAKWLTGLFVYCTLPVQKRWYNLYINNLHIHTHTNIYIYIYYTHTNIYRVGHVKCYKFISRKRNNLEKNVSDKSCMVSRGT